MMPLREPLYDGDQGWLFPPSLDHLVSANKRGVGEGAVVVKCVNPGALSCVII